MKGEKLTHTTQEAEGRDVLSEMLERRLYGSRIAFDLRRARAALNGEK